eukprot:CAMPEP_0194261354 /NCGR_PEP_ID=MMETSP0158-20130606/45983_1 /TAXON_ID=33649 /ORGANISM="Thalassionema nitzschioides, Strain L26-B" /LENGTH=604 /DNA_ID=CAMNT_0039001473 /DNA_START=183 /DNA_END=1997 /DNA_ORIENTATION=+
MLRPLSKNLSPALVILLVQFLFPLAHADVSDWTSNWTASRFLESSFDVDPFDPRAMMRGSGDVDIGSGIAKFLGSPRLYIDKGGYTTSAGFENVEFTAYGTYITLGNGGKSYSGLTLAARSNHDNYSTDPCDAAGYYARIYQNTGECAFQKEHYHSSSTGTVYTATRRTPCFVGGLPFNQTIGMKFKVTTITDSSIEPAGSVLLELYLDENDSGNFVLKHSSVDRPGEWLPSGGKTVPSECSIGDGDTVLGPRNVCFLRSDGVDTTNVVEWKDASILNTLVDTTNGGFNGDPTILGLQHQVFKFEGRSDGWYANLHNSLLKWNMQFRKFEDCPQGEDMFVSAMTLSTGAGNIYIKTTPEPTEECRSDPNIVCLGEGTLHISLDGGKTFLSQPGDYHSSSAESKSARIVAHNTYAACSRKWHDYQVVDSSSTSSWSHLLRENDRHRQLAAAATVVEKKPLQLLLDNKLQMIDPNECHDWIQERAVSHDLFQQRGHWSTIYVETPLVSFHVEYRRSDFNAPTCNFQSLDAWMTQVSPIMEHTKSWNGILGETKHKVFSKTNPGEEVLSDRYELLRGSHDADYEVDGPFGTYFTASQENDEPNKKEA